MTDREALLRAILLDPADDLPRRVFADWLEENGEPERAEFVRVQVEIASRVTCVCCNLIRCIACMSVAGLREREAEVWETRTAAGGWLIPDPLPQPAHVCIPPNAMAREGVDTTLQTAVFRRGFVDEIRLPLAAFLAHAESLFSAHPITAVRLTNREPEESRQHRGMWRWFTEDNSLPERLYHLLIRPAETPSSSAQPYWDTRPAALSALSAACVAYGRQLAGLRSLQPALTSPALAR